MSQNSFLMNWDKISYRLQRNSEAVQMHNNKEPEEPMENAREIQSRIKSVQDTMKITNAMYMISSSKM